ncbi:hypothetical protein LV831_18790 [[Clostridium] innocuum]|nr:hypothetical protein [[Clostridium] innocuum]MCI3006537.1 hypothetical protein [[Clostridium] innocuum]
MHTLFTLEDVYGLTVSEADGEVCLKVSKDKGKEAYELLQMLYARKEQTTSSLLAKSARTIMTVGVTTIRNTIPRNFGLKSLRKS